MQSGVRFRGDNQKNQLRVCERASDHRGFVVQISPVHVKMEHESLEQRDAIQIKDATPSLSINQFAARYSGPDTKDLLITVPPTKLGFPRSQTMIKDGGFPIHTPHPLLVEEQGYYIFVCFGYGVSGEGSVFEPP